MRDSGKYVTRSGVQITENFTSGEFVSPDTGQIYISERLVQELQRIRDRIGKPLYVLSGFRTVGHNLEVGGVKNSYHLKGMAADVTANLDPVKLMTIAESEWLQKRIGGVGFYPTFVHLDIGPVRQWQG